jgi:hypothetical protein
MIRFSPGCNCCPEFGCDDPNPCPACSDSGIPTNENIFVDSDGLLVPYFNGKTFELTPYGRDFPTPLCCSWRLIERVQDSQPGFWEYIDYQIDLTLDNTAGGTLAAVGFLQTYYNQFGFEVAQHSGGGVETNAQTTCQDLDLSDWTIKDPVTADVRIYL